MNYFLKRYLHGVSKRRGWFVLVLLLPAFYLFALTLQADRFTIMQSISINESAPVALTSKPTGFVPLEELIENPEIFFLNRFAVNTLSGDIFIRDALNTVDEQALVNEIKQNMTLVMADKDTLKIQYYGEDLKTGGTLVDFYAKRLLNGSTEGVTRSNMTLPDASLIPTYAGGLYIIEHRALWRSERLLPTMQIIIVSLLAIMILQWGLEWSDPSFKSERQLGQYLNLPVLGSVPDIGNISMKIEANPDITY